MEDSRKEKGKSEQSDNPALDLHKKLVEIADKVPQEALHDFPPDFSENLDHYLYGVPKKTL